MAKDKHAITGYRSKTSNSDTKCQPFAVFGTAIAVHVQATDNHIGTIRYFGIL
jgi:hypothetical protein